MLELGGKVERSVTIAGRIRGRIRVLAILLVALGSGGLAADAQVEDQGESVEACLGCHAQGTAAPVGDINSPSDLHYVDLDSRGPETESGYRQLNVTLTSVDLTSSQNIPEWQIVVLFNVTDENDAAVDDIYPPDGRLVLAKLVDGSAIDPPSTSGNPTEWQRLASEGFTSAAGSFERLGEGNYRYTLAPPLPEPPDPPVPPLAITSGDTLRAVVEISASDLPAGNGWCDFDADLSEVNDDCDGPTTLTRDIVQTVTCNGCHGVTSDTKLAFHGNGGRTQVEYCVTCHNPTNFAEGMTSLIHKIHYGSELTQEYRDGKYAHVVFTRDIDNCTSCHEQGGVDEDNWKTEPNKTSCGSCHDDVNFETGVGHPGGNQQPNNSQCAGCHPPDGDWTALAIPISTVHQGVARTDEGAGYRGEGNGFSLDGVSYDMDAETIQVDFSVRNGGEKMDLRLDDRWKEGGRLNLRLGWSTEDYTNDGSDSSPAPAQPVGFDALDFDETVTDEGDGNYRAILSIEDFGFGNVTVGMDGRPVGDLLDDDIFSSIEVRSAYATVNVEERGTVQPHRQVIDIDKCNLCHDSGGSGLSFHGGNRTSEMQVCVLCHNPNVTDIRQRPADPSDALDGKREESVDIKRMVHQIHSGRDLTEGVVIYGYGMQPHDYSEVNFVGNNRNCLTCHLTGTYSTEDASTTLPSTIDTGEDVTDPSDDLNISPITAVCSSCHDTEIARNHMIANGGSFGSLDEDIAVATAVPEPGAWELSLAGLVTLAALARRRLRPHNRVEVESGTL